jgi:hypothetical protein
MLLGQTHTYEVKQDSQTSTLHMLRMLNVEFFSIASHTLCNGWLFDIALGFLLFHAICLL